MKSTLILLLITIIIFPLAGQQSYLPSVKTFTTKDGLSSNVVHAIHKDSRGFIWIGTEYGLNRFDGQEFDLFTRENQEHMTIEAIHKIASDGQGHLWILKSREKYDYDYTFCELNIFDTYSSQAIDLNTYFKDGLPFDAKKIVFFQQLDSQSIIIQTHKDKEAFIYNRNDGFKRLPYPKTIDVIRNVFQLPNGELLLSGYDLDQRGYFYRLSSNGKILEILDYKLRLDVTSKATVQSYNASGFWTLPTYDHLKKYPRLPKKHSFPSIFQSDYNEKEQLFWFRLRERVLVVNRDNQLVFQLPYETIEQAITSLPLLFDGEKTWFSDGENGIQIITLQADYFQNTIPFSGNLSNSMRGLLKDKTGNLWCSFSNSIGRFGENNQLEILNSQSGFSSFLEDNEGYVWWKTKGKLNKFNPNNSSIQSYLSDKIEGFTWAIKTMKNGEIWMSESIKVIAFNPMTETFREAVDFTSEGYSISDFYIYDIQEDINDLTKIWICTNRGLFLCNHDGKILDIYNDKQEKDYYLPATSFHHLYQSTYHSGRDEKDVIWLATGNGGLIRWMPITHGTSPNDERMVNKTDYRQYTISSGLSSNAIHAIYEDDYDYLWMSSDYGLMQFDKKNEQVTKYFINNGTVENEFNRTSHFQAANGTLYFGSVNGFSSFHPKHFANARDKQKAPQLTFKTFQKFSNQQSSLVDLTNELLNTSTITLRPGDRFFNVELALLDFYNGQNSTFHYRIKGLYDWQSSKNSTLNFSSLPYGKHTLEISAQNGNGQQSANNLVFKVRVLRPFYLRWWFVVLVLTVLGVSAFYFIKWRTQQLLVAQETEQLKSLDKLKTKFFANISHELRTPLTLIIAPLRQLLTKEEISNTDKPSLKKIYNNSESLLNLVNEILDLSKLEADKLSLDEQPTLTPQFFKQIVNQFESAAMVKNIDYQFDFMPSESVSILLDQNKIEKIINNLLANAIKFTPKNGQVRISFEISNSKASDTYLYIKVKDSGRGIPQEDIPYIFDRYFQSKNNTVLEGGTGIGLALTKELIELMNGQIAVQSKVKEGTLFDIKLPVVLVEENIIVEENVEISSLVGFQRLDDLGQAPASTEKDTILLVEDNPSLQEFIQSILAPYYNVIVTGNGVEALKQLAVGRNPLAENSGALPTANYQLILSDVMMPEMDGFTLLEKVKAHDDYCSIPFILLTARADIQDKLHGLRIGVDDYMTKPFVVEELLLRIKNLISNTKNRKIEEEGELEEFTPEVIIETTVEATKEPVISRKELKWLEEVEAIILKSLTRKPFTLGDLASELYISQRQMSRKIKSITGLTPNRYIRSIRLHRAKVLLETEDFTTLSEISYSIGMENTTHFSQLFEQEFGKRPHDYLA